MLGASARLQQRHQGLRAEGPAESFCGPTVVIPLLSDEVQVPKHGNEGMKDTVTYLYIYV